MPLRNTSAKCRSRRGSMIIEVVVAAILFGTALVALGRLARTSTSLNVVSDQRLSAKLTAQNALVRLNLVDFDDVHEQIETIQKRLSQLSEMSIQIQAEPFPIADKDAMKMTVRVMDETGATNITLHDWRVKPTEAAVAKTGDDQDTESDQPNTSQPKTGQPNAGDSEDSNE